MFLHHSRVHFYWLRSFRLLNLDRLVRISQSGSAGGLAAESLTKGAGVWEVFYMPHIRTIAEPLGELVGDSRD